MTPDQVIGSYHDLWHVEQSFRMSKTDLAARPMFVRTKDAIEAHLTIVFTALAVARTVQHRSGLAVRNVVRQLRPLRSATIAINGATQTFRPPSIPVNRNFWTRSSPEIQGTNEKTKLRPYAPARSHRPRSREQARRPVRHHQPRHHPASRRPSFTASKRSPEEGSTEQTIRRPSRRAARPNSTRP